MGDENLAAAPFWGRLIDLSRGPDGLLDTESFKVDLIDDVAAEYRAAFSGSLLVEFPHGPVTYLFDTFGDERAERTVLAVARSERPLVDRDVSYQRGYPIREQIAGRALDRGHFVPHTAGGLFGPNLFVQDRALNRGWSRDGRAYRALERAAVEAGPGAVFFARPLYCDDSDVPAFVELGLVRDSGLTVRRFRNRFDVVSGSDAERLETYLGGATDSHIGALGEETASVLLEDVLGATIVAMGDAGLPRDGHRQDLDLVVVIEGELLAYEVKSRYASRLAGRLTRSGNLLRPRLRRPGTPLGFRQGSQDYVTERLADYVDVEGDYAGIDVRVIVIDFAARLCQQFAVNDAGNRLTPIGSPTECEAEMIRALTRVLEHRGYL